MLRITFVRPSGEKVEIKAPYEGHHIAVPSKAADAPKDVLASARIWWDRKLVQKKDAVDYDRLMEVVSGDRLEISRNIPDSTEASLVFTGTVLEALTDGPQIVVLSETPFPELKVVPCGSTEEAPAATCCRSESPAEESRAV